MRRIAPVLIALLACGAAPAMAEEAGGASAPVNTAKAGGVQPGTGLAPIAHLSVRSGTAPRATVRFVEPGADFVVARTVILRTPGNAVAGRAELGRVPTGRPVSIDVGSLPPGTYVVRVHAHDQWENQLRRSGRTTGKATLVVKAKPQPKPQPQPDPEPTTPVSSNGVFPVAGPYTFGEGFGVDRGDHAHQGQDMAAAAGTPIVAPVAGTVVSTDYQAGAAGYYVVLNGTDGRSYFFCHMQKGSFAVSEGDTVAAGARLGLVGSTGRSSGPHLHFEIWVNGWRTSSKSKPIDPRPQLEAWAN
jgi:murein DD-endopeptidase MepM/ murein hydrolase activator NlpD